MNAYLVKKAKLIAFVDRAHDICTNLDMRTGAERLSATKEGIQSDCFRILITGRFNSGKSTFINALIGEKILPTYPIPCTAIINEIKYSENKKATVYFKNPMPTELSFIPSEDIQSHIDRFRGANLPIEPMDAPVERLNDYVTIPYDKDYSVVGRTPFERVDIFWPLDLCRNGVEVVDSPGLDEDSIRDEIVLNYLPTTDAIINVMAVKDVGAASGLKFIKQIQGENKFEDIFFVITHFDEIDVDERDIVQQHAISKLQALTSLQEDGVFFLSSTQALAGKKQQNSDLIDSSGITELEGALFSYLANERGQVKLLRPTHEILAILRDVQSNIQMKRDSVNASLQEVEQRIQAVQPRLLELNNKKDRLLLRIERKRVELREDVRKKFYIWLMDIEPKLPQWIDEIELETDPEQCQTKEELSEKIGFEVKTKLRDTYDTEFEAWQENTLRELLSDFEDDVTESIQVIQHEINTEIQSIRSEVSGASYDMDLSVEVTEPNIDMKGVYVAYAAIAAGSVAGFILIGSIFVIPILFFGRGALKSWISSRKKGAIKSSVKKQIMKQWAEVSPEMAEKLSEQVFAGTQKYVQHIEKNIGGDIQSLQEQIESLLEEKRRSVETAETALQVLDVAESTCIALRDEVEEYRSRIPAGV